MGPLFLSNSVNSVTTHKIDVTGSKFNSLLGRRGSILCVDDERITRMFMKRCLTNLGFEGEVICVENGEEALEVYRMKKSQIEMIFMDIAMPKMDGFEATWEIRRLEEKDRLQQVPIVCISSHAQRRRKTWRKVGMNGKAAKPISKDKIRLVCNKCLSPKGVKRRV